MSELAKKLATYDDLYHVPDNMTGEIINGELIATPRPSRRHVVATSMLGGDLITTYARGKGGPGGWIILIEPEIGLGSNILVPDLAGWKKERFPIEEPHNWISAAPDWVCEILSPGTASLDKHEKMPIYAQHEVAHAWLIDPIGTRTLDVFRLEFGGWWRLLESYGDRNTKVRAEPFQEIEIDLDALWLEA
ncbi:MAG: Uma2 family endonuclease [Syntrophobacteraceae bacterium]